MSGRYFRQNNWKRVEGVLPSISYAYIPITYNKENANEEFFDPYYPINVVLAKNTISFYSSNVLDDSLGNKPSLQYYQSQAFLSFSLEDESALEGEVKRIGTLISDESTENIFTFSKGLSYKEINKSNERKNTIGTDFLARTLPDLNGVIKNNQNNYYKIIFLNFLNDFFYSNTFQRDPNYKRTRQILEENKTIKAILAKGYYLYVLEKNKELLKEKEVEQKKTAKKWKSRLKDAAKNWHELIINKEYADVIEADKTWFENKETEHKNLMKNLDSPEILNLYKEEDTILSTDQVTASVTWLSSRYDLLGAFSSQFRYLEKREKPSLIRALAVLLGLFGVIVMGVEVKTIFFSCQLVELLHSYKGILGIGFILVSSFSIISGFFIEKINILIFPFQKGIVIVTIIVFFFCSFIFIPNLLMFIVFLFLLAGGGVLFFALLTILQRLWSSNSFTSSILSIPKFLQLFKPRILLASTVVWAAIYASSELWNIDFVIGVVEVILLVVTLLIFLSFVFSKLKELTKLDSYTLLRRSSFLIILSFIYSIGLGISATTIAMKNTFVKEGYYKDFFKKLDNTIVDSTTKKTALQARLDTGNIFLQVVSDTTIKDTLYDKTKEILYRNVIGKSKLDSIIAYTKPKANADKILLEKILPLLKRTASSDDNCKLVYHIKINMPQWKNANSSKPFFFEFYIVPDFLIFYSIIATVIGMFIELFLKQRE